MSKVIFALVVLSFVCGTSLAQQEPIDGVDARSNPAEFAKGLGSTDPLVRQRSAEALYSIVNDLDSGRQQQAVGYLSDLESPDVLYPFLKRANNAPRINAGLLKALAHIGDAQTLELVKPFLESHQPYVAEAAEVAHDEIEKRLSEPAAATTRARPRTVEKPADRP